MRRLWILWGCVFACAGSALALEAVSIREYAVFPESDGAYTIESPGAIVVLADGTVALADPDGRKVVLTRSGGRRIVLNVRSTALAAQGNQLLVAEARQVRQFDAEGREGALVADRTMADFSHISGLTTDVRGNLFIADDGNDVVFVLSPDGVMLNVIGENAREPAELSNPSDVALDGRGSVYVLDRSNERIAVFSTGGSYRFAITGFEDPSALTVDSAGLIYVADADACRVQRFDAAGHLLGAFGTRGRERGQFRAISGLTVSGDGDIRVTDGRNRTLHVLRWPSGVIGGAEVLPLSARLAGAQPGERTPLGPAGAGRLAVATEGGVVITDSTLRELGRLPAELREPVAAAVDLEGHIYVVDRSAGEIKVYDRDLNPLFGIGRGSRILFFRGGDGKLVKPRAVALSPRGILAVADVDKVELFGPDGTYLAPVATKGDEQGQIEEPVGVAFDADGNLFVADEENRRITKFDSSGAYAGHDVEDVRPLALATDAHGRVYVLEERGPRIRVFSSDLAPLLSIAGTGRLSLRGARSMVCVEDRLYVSRRDDVAVIDLDLPLPAPRDVIARPGVREVTLAWNPTATPLARGYVTEVRTAAGASLLQGGWDATRETNARTITGLADEADYLFTVRGLNRLGAAGYPAPAVAARTLALALPAPGAPRVAYAGDGARVILSWPVAESPYVAGYVVEGASRDAAGRDGAWTRLTEVATLSSSATPRAAANGIATSGASAASVSGGVNAELPAGPSRRYRVRALADNGREGPPSPEVVHAAADGFDALASGSDALAAERLRAATIDEPDNARVWRGLGEASERLERFTEALSAYQKAMALASTDTKSALGLARIALLRGDSPQARSALARVFANGDAPMTDPEAVYVRGRLALASEEYDTAVRLLAVAVAGQPSARNRAALTQAEELQRQFGENRPRLELLAASIRPIFPALYKTYAGASIGTVTVRNGGRLPLERVRFSVFIRGAMDFPSDTVIARLAPGESQLIPIYAELSNSILDVTEDETHQAELRLTYYRSGEPVEVRATTAFQLYARTALTWSDPARIAAFVTGRAPVVAEFARNVASWIADRPAACEPLARAQILRHAIAAYGVRYVEDPRHPFRVVSENAEAVDHVQLPEETLRNRAGDCDDLVVLMSALLENLGVQTAVVDLPGHVALLVNTELPPEAASGLCEPDMWVEHGGTVWAPVETTLIDGGWDESARAASRAVAEAKSAGAPVRVIELGAAWRVYPPVTTQSSAWRASLPDRAEVLARWTTDDRIMRLRRAAALGSAYVNRDDADARNRLAVIHARLGLYHEADSLLAGLATAAALNNRGNVALLKGDAAAARTFYDQALALDPEDSGIQRNVLRTENEGTHE